MFVGCMDVGPGTEPRTTVLTAPLPFGSCSKKMAINASGVSDSTCVAQLEQVRLPRHHLQKQPVLKQANLFTTSTSCLRILRLFTTLQGQPLDLSKFAHLVQAVANGASAPAQGCAVLVDCTATDSVPDLYLEWIKAGMHVVSPNKKVRRGSAVSTVRPRECALKHCFRPGSTSLGTSIWAAQQKHPEHVAVHRAA